MTDAQRVRFACWLQVQYRLWGWLGPYLVTVQEVK